MQGVYVPIAYLEICNRADLLQIRNLLFAGTLTGKQRKMHPGPLLSIRDNHTNSDQQPRTNSSMSIGIYYGGHARSS